LEEECPICSEPLRSRHRVVTICCMLTPCPWCPSLLSINTA
jgi:hypothetical protein